VIRTILLSTVRTPPRHRHGHHRLSSSSSSSSSSRGCRTMAHRDTATLNTGLDGRTRAGRRRRLIAATSATSPGTGSRNAPMAAATAATAAAATARTRTFTSGSRDTAETSGSSTHSHRRCLRRNRTPFNSMRSRLCQCHRLHPSRHRKTQHTLRMSSLPRTLKVSGDRVTTHRLCHRTFSHRSPRAHRLLSIPITSFSISTSSSRPAIRTTNPNSSRHDSRSGGATHVSRPS
jgi:hypothetical protein